MLLKIFEVFLIFQLWIVVSPGESWAGVPRIPLGSPLGEMGTSQNVCYMLGYMCVNYLSKSISFD